MKLGGMASDIPNPPQFTVSALRAELGLTLEAFAERVGSNKGRMSMIERGLERPSLPVALAIERISGGRIDAAALNDDVAAARRLPRPVAMTGEGFAA
jgi:transcriptional regulator with XRE-family HTH domain